MTPTQATQAYRSFEGGRAKRLDQATLPRLALTPAAEPEGAASGVSVLFGASGPRRSGIGGERGRAVQPAEAGHELVGGYQCFVKGLAVVEEAVHLPGV